MVCAGFSLLLGRGGFQNSLPPFFSGVITALRRSHTAVPRPAERTGRAGAGTLHSDAETCAERCAYTPGESVKTKWKERMTEKMTGDNKQKAVICVRTRGASLSVQPAGPLPGCCGDGLRAGHGLLGGPARCRWPEWVPSPSPGPAGIRRTSGPGHPAEVSATPPPGGRGVLAPRADAPGLGAGACAAWSARGRGRPSSL